MITGPLLPLGPHASTLLARIPPRRPNRLVNLSKQESFTEIVPKAQIPAP